MVRETTLCHDRAAARGRCGAALRGHRDVRQEYARVDRGIIDDCSHCSIRVADSPRDLALPSLSERLVDGTVPIGTAS